jgi:hypothetical protein
MVVPTCGMRDPRQRLSAGTCLHGVTHYTVLLMSVCNSQYRASNCSNMINECRSWWPMVFNLEYVKTSYGLCKIEKIVFRDNHWIIGARFTVSHRRPGRKGILFSFASFIVQFILWRVAQARGRRASCLATKLLALILYYSLSTLTGTLVHWVTQGMFTARVDARWMYIESSCVMASFQPWGNVSAWMLSVSLACSECSIEHH